MPVKCPRALSGVGNDRRRGMVRRAVGLLERGPADADLGPRVEQRAELLERAGGDLVSGLSAST